MSFGVPNASEADLKIYQRFLEIEPVKQGDMRYCEGLDYLWMRGVG